MRRDRRKKRKKKKKLTFIFVFTFRVGFFQYFVFFVMVLVARYLGPDRLGAYAYLFGLAALAMPLAQFGMEAVVRRVEGATSRIVAVLSYDDEPGSTSTP